ncbi:MAG: DNA/RNA nuclease SfsA [Myxococcota bacterium]|nr:DNA/RNA nuclease SfsA [Myxococcota bacterium]
MANDGGRIPFNLALSSGVLLKRYKRFLADIRLDSGEEITAHCANSGAMTSCVEPGAKVWVSDSNNPKRKLRYTWELIRMTDSWVGVNTANPNRLVTTWTEMGAFSEFESYSKVRREVKYGEGNRSRIDILLSEGKGVADCYVEIKNATLRVDDAVAFPDAVTTRGQKHIRDLVSVVEDGHRGVLFFFVGRTDCSYFRPADEVDKEYGRLLREAVDVGVEVIVQEVDCLPEGFSLGRRLELSL